MSENTPVTKKKTSVKSTNTRSSDETINALLQELKKDRESRDQQIDAMSREIRQVFNAILDDTEKRDELRNKELQHLVSGIENAFSRVEITTEQRDHRNDQILAKLSESILTDHQNLQSEVTSQDKLHDKKLQHLGKQQEEQVRKTKLIAIPGILLAFFAAIFMFYTVHVVEVAMTSMSNDMQVMKQTMETMSEDTHNMAVNTGYMSKEMNVLTHNVAPAMTGMRRMMPWSP